MSKPALSRKAAVRNEDFTSGMKKLSANSQNYIQNLVNVLLLVDQSTYYKAGKRKLQNRKTARMGCL